MKLCTHAEILAITPGGIITEMKIIDVSWTGDSHQFGIRDEPDGLFLHLEGGELQPAQPGIESLS
jgi:hypothetical protein